MGASPPSPFAPDHDQVQLRRQMAGRRRPPHHPSTLQRRRGRGRGSRALHHRAELRAQGLNILQHLIEKRLAFGGPELNGPARFLWKGIGRTRRWPVQVTVSAGLLMVSVDTTDCDAALCRRPPRAQGSERSQGGRRLELPGGTPGRASRPAPGPRSRTQGNGLKVAVQWNRGTGYYALIDVTHSSGKLGRIGAGRGTVRGTMRRTIPAS
jgi:hypothetical protein